jgi:hypothetical protein
MKGAAYPTVVIPNNRLNLLLIYTIVFSILMLAGLVLLWPDTNTNSTRVVVMGSNEIQMLLIVALAGGVGSTVRLLRIIPRDFRKFFDKMQKDAQDKNGSSFERGIPLYLARPFLGPPVAVILYFGLRGGLLSANTTITAINPFGMAALGGLAGLFADSAVDKLKNVFDVFLGIKPEQEPSSEEEPTTALPTG